jgi:hypothetical protein
LLPRLKRGREEEEEEKKKNLKNSVFCFVFVCFKKFPFRFRETGELRQDVWVELFKIYYSTLRKKRKEKKRGLVFLFSFRVCSNSSV